MQKKKKNDGNEIKINVFNKTFQTKQKPFHYTMKKAILKVKMRSKMKMVL